MRMIIFSIESLSPLLMHSTKGMEGNRGSDKVGTKKIPAAEDEAEEGSYRDEEGYLYVPCIFFRQAAVSAGKGRKIGKHHATTLLRGGLIDQDERARIVDPETGEYMKDYKIDERAVVIGKSRVMRARPRIEHWACEVPLLYDDEVFDDPETLVDVMSMAGSRVGVGDYRVEKDGWFGRFKVTGYRTED